MTALGAAAGAGVALLLCLVRVFVGPTLYDRTLAANGIVIKLAIIAAAAAVFAGRSAWIDVAVALALGALVLNVAALKFFGTRTFQAPLSRAEEM